MISLNKSLVIDYRVKEFNVLCTSTFYLGALYLRTWLGFKGVGYLYNIDIDIISKKIVFFFDSGFKIKPYFYYDDLKVVITIAQGDIYFPYFFRTWRDFDELSVQRYWLQKELFFNNYLRKSMKGNRFRFKMDVCMRFFMFRKRDE